MPDYFQGPHPGERISPTKRLEYVERDLRDHAKSLTALADAGKNMQDRLVALERSVQDWRVAEARKEERALALQKWMHKVDEDLKSIRGVGTKLLWIVGGSVVTAFVAFLLRGGIVSP